MTPNEKAFWSVCMALPQIGYVLWLERIEAFMSLSAPQAPEAPKTERPKLTVVR